MINYDLKKIRAIIMDVDGVLSQETIPMNEVGVPCRTVNIKDGYALQLAVKMGLRVAVITGARVESVRVRYEGLGIEDVFIGAAVKMGIYEKLIQKYGLCDEQVLYVGDDIPDYEVMCRCGCPCCPSDAAAEIKAISQYISPINGGMGCVRDIVEQVMRAQGIWMADKRSFGW
ncbi:MAG: HAD hydrolase family protein [Bacteroidaceae bacterium]|nr:HAD hydrolase family protein [Bacteroidaceae bacterium]